MTKPIPLLHLDRPARYRLRLQGRVSAKWTDWLSDPSVAFEGRGPAATTILTGTVSDQASLFGLLSFIRDLAVPLIALELIHSGSSENDGEKSALSSTTRKPHSGSLAK